ncbi:MAG: S41 family peptidase [Prolixibacteraceae bacterium]|nr:S41 family peptidase [Prolixibacteraceae bacterium]MBN2772963.1 S41 family peptidase [Prolixibacteraceae bacterium]
MKNKVLIYIPIIIAVTMAAGIFLGNSLKRNSQVSYSGFNMGTPNKIGTILSLVEQGYVDSVNISDIVEKTIPEILKNLDPHTVYIPARNMQEVREEMQGNFSGIGVQFSIQEDTVRVVDVVANGPSFNVGLQDGDRIVTVNDSIIAGVEIRNDEVLKLLKGEKGSKVNVGIIRSGVDEMLNFEIIRGDIPIYSVDVSYMVNEETGYIKITRFAETTYDEFMDGVRKLMNHGAQKIIIDLRSNVGGYLTSVLRMVDEFLEKDEPILYTLGVNQPKKTYNASARNSLAGLGVYILIDEQTASASEILAGAMQDNDRGLIIGRRSFGKGLVQEQIPLTDGSALRLTIARYYTPSGRSIQKPYNEGREKYYEELYDRMYHGEFIDVDSITVADSLKYKTKSGRIVYGGGGIIPDIFVPADTTGISEYLARLTNRGIIYQFAYFYADHHRSELSEFSNADQIENYLDKNNILNELLEYARGKGVPTDKSGLKESELIIKTQAKAYIARNIIGEEGFYPIIKQIDNTLLKAIEVTKQNLLVENVHRN